jgi:hypothetical protein
LKPWVENPRLMSGREREKLKTSIREFDVVEIPVVDTENVLVSGHRRVEVLSADGRGDEEVEVRVPSRKLTEKEFARLNLTLNRVHGEFDLEKLIAFDPETLLGGGFNPNEILGILKEGEGDGEPEVDFPVEIGETSQYVVLVFNDEMDWAAAREFFALKTAKSRRDKAGYRQRGIGRVVDGAAAMKKILGERDLV